jgi:hypothetical protein
MADGPTFRVGDADSLYRALADSPAGARIAIAEGFTLPGDAVIDRPLHLLAAPGARPMLRFDEDSALVLRPGGAGSSLAGLGLTGARPRRRALLVLQAAADLSLSDLLLLEAQGVGIEATGCARLRLAAVALAELGLEGALLTGCTALDGEVTLAGIGRRARSAGLVLAGGDGRLRLRAREVSGNALTLQPAEAGGAPGPGHLLELEVAQSWRALAASGTSEAPLAGLRIRLAAEAMDDCAALLNGCRDLELELRSRDAMPLRLGKAGLQDCRLRLACDLPPALPAPVLAANSVTLLPPGEWSPLDLPPRRATFPLQEREGPCHVCGRRGRFRRAHAAVRETFTCQSCRASWRYRGQAAALLAALGQEAAGSLATLAAGGGLAALSVFEPGIAGPLRPYLQQAGQYVDSVFQPGLPSGTPWQGRICQDLTATSFADACFDLVVSSDIMEHVRQPERAWAELRRILKPGGRHVFTIPVLAPMRPRSVPRVDTSGPEDRHLLPPHYHGDGAGGRSLVYTDFGADLLAQLAALGLPTTVMPFPGDDPLAGEVLTFVSRRAD